MRRSGLFSARVVLAVLPLAACAQQELARQGDQWVRTYYGTAPAAPRLRVNAHGPVTVEGGVSPNVSYQVKVSVKARTAAEAQGILDRYAVKLAAQGDWLVLTAPGGPFLTAVSVKAPHLAGAGRITVGTVHGEAVLATEGGDIVANDVGGRVRAQTRAGGIHIVKAGGVVTATSGGGRIMVDKAGGVV